MKTDVPVFLQHSLLDLRTRLGLSQKEAANRLGISRQTIRAWERDSTKISYENIVKLTEVYKIPQDYIFFGTDNSLRVILKGLNVKSIN